MVFFLPGNEFISLHQKSYFFILDSISCFLGLICSSVDSFLYVFVNNLDLPIVWNSNFKFNMIPYDTLEISKPCI